MPVKSLPTGFRWGKRAVGSLHCANKNPAGIALVPSKTSFGPRKAAPETPLTSEQSGSQRGERVSAPPVLACISGPCPSSNSSGWLPGDGSEMKGQIDGRREYATQCKS
jgi:hypothetical protein